MVTMLSAALILMRHGLSRETVLFVPLSFILAECAFADLEMRVIPDEVLKAGLVYRMAAAACAENVLRDIVNAVAGAAVLFCFLFPVSLMYEKARGRMSVGGGDIKLFTLAGAYIGAWSGLEALIAACALGLVYGLFCRARHQAFPWGPAIAVGVLAVMLDCRHW